MQNRTANLFLFKKVLTLWVLLPAKIKPQCVDLHHRICWYLLHLTTEGWPAFVRLAKNRYGLPAVTHLNTNLHGVH